VPVHELLYDQMYIDDLEDLDAFDIPIVRDAVLGLRHHAEQVVRNRRPLRSSVPWCPEATWQLRVRGHRVLYRIEGGTVVVLRVRSKASGTTEEMGP